MTDLPRTPQEPSAEDTSTQKPKSAFEQAEPTREMSFFREVWWFVVDYRAWWLTPILLALLALGAIAIVNGTGAAPFVYSFF